MLEDYKHAISGMSPGHSVGLLRARITNGDDGLDQLANWVHALARLMERHASLLEIFLQKHQVSQAALGTLSQPWTNVAQVVVEQASAATVFSQRLLTEIEPSLHQISGTREWRDAKAAVEGLDQLMGVSAWESNSPELVARVQAADVARLDMLRELMIKMQTFQADYSQVANKAAERSMQDLLNFDPQEDIQSFVAQIVSGTADVQAAPSEVDQFAGIPKDRHPSIAGQKDKHHILPIHRKAQRVASKSSLRDTESIVSHESTTKTSLRSRMGTLLGRKKKEPAKSSQPPPAAPAAAPAAAAPTASQSSAGPSSSNQPPASSRSSRERTAKQPPRFNSPPKQNTTLPPPPPPPQRRVNDDTQPFERRDSRSSDRNLPQPPVLGVETAQSSSTSSKAESPIDVPSALPSSSNFNAGPSQSGFGGKPRSRDEITSSMFTDVSLARRESVAFDNLDLNDHLAGPSQSSQPGLSNYPRQASMSNSLLPANETSEDNMVVDNDTAEDPWKAQNLEALAEHEARHTIAASGNSGISAKLIEKVNSKFSLEGKQIECSTSGEIQIACHQNQSGVQPLRVLGVEWLKQFVPSEENGSAAVAGAQTGEFSVDLASLSTVGALPLASYITEQPTLNPLVIVPVWRIEPTQTRLMINVEIAEGYPLTEIHAKSFVLTVSVGGGQAKSAQSKPFATFSKEKQRVTWRLTDTLIVSTAQPTRFLCQFVTEAAVDMSNCVVEAHYSLEQAPTAVRVDLVNAANQTEVPATTSTFVSATSANF